MVNVHFEGDNRHRLEDDSGMWIGWIHGRSIGLRGMRDEAEATATVIALWEPLQATLAQHFPGRPVHTIRPSRMHVVHDGAFEWISDGLTPLARLLRRSGTRGAEQIAIEFALPSYANEGVVVSVAHVVALALLTHRAERERALKLVVPDRARRGTMLLTRGARSSGGPPFDAA
ncbi:MAG TPA: hypothetical protein VF761_05970 [Gemmatimonadaceae bacterium]